MYVFSTYRLCPRKIQDLSLSDITGLLLVLIHFRLNLSLMQLRLHVRVYEC